MALLFYWCPADNCYVSKILTVSSEPVISFFNKGKLILLGLPFCIFVTNTIYVISMNLILVVVLARKHKSGKAPILMLDCMISQVSCGL
jgi:hypothetical protein